MSTLRELLQRADSYDAGYLAGSKDAHRLLSEVKQQLNVLIERAVRRGEYEALVHARQILRRLK